MRTETRTTNITGISGNTAVDLSAAPEPTPIPKLEVADAYVGPRSEAPRPILLYNDQCQVCRVVSGWVKRTDAAGQDLIDERPIGNDPSALTAINPSLDIWNVYEKIHLIMPDGQIKTGGEAIAEVLRRLDSTRWIGNLSDVSIFGKRPVLALIEAAYNLLDKIRPALGCETCGGGAVPWWAMPIKWVADAYKKLNG